MVLSNRLLACVFAAALAPVAVGQVILSPAPSRVLGHPQASLRTVNPNFVEGKELYQPFAVAVDTASTPPILYVADTFNNRVLAWRNASQFANGAMADMVIGQQDFTSTNPLGPGTEFNSGLYYPAGLAVDARGDLFVADSGNNRVLRYPRPFDNPRPALPDLVIGQRTLTARDANKDPDTATISGRTLRLFHNNAVYGAMLFDRDGNLFVADGGNHRVLRFPAGRVGPGAAFTPEADLVLGQPTFNRLDPPAPANSGDLTAMRAPVALAMDPSRRLYVCDALHRVLVYPALMFNGAAAERRLGGVLNAQNNLQPPTQQSLNEPNGIFFVGDRPYVVDSRNHRILRFSRFEEWPGAAVPAADGLIGQATYTDFRPNRNAPWPVTAIGQAPAVSFNYPTAAVVAADELFLADSGNNRVIVLPVPGSTMDGAISARRVVGQSNLDDDGPNRVESRGFNFGDMAAGLVGRLTPGLAVDTRANPPRLYVADTANNRILGFPDARTVKLSDPAAIIIGQPSDNRAAANWAPQNVGTPSEHGLFYPQGLAVDSEGNLWVADSANGRVLRYPPPSFEPGAPRPVANLVLGKRSFTATRESAPDPTADNFSYPVGLAFTTGGHLLVSDAEFNRVLLFMKPAGGFISGMPADKVFGQTGFFSRTAAATDANRQNFNTPLQISADSDDRLLICDFGLNRILIIDSITERTSGAAADASITSLGSALGTLQSPRGIFSSPATGETWVAARTTSRGLGLLRIRPTFTAPDFFVGGSSSEIPLGVTATGSGTPLVAVSSHRVMAYSPASTITNASNYEPEIAPGMYATLWPFSGFVFPVSTTVAPRLPLPNELSDLQLLINGAPSPLHFLSPGQINFVVPKSSPTSGSLEVQLVRKSTGEILAVGCTQNFNRTGCLDPYLPLQASSYSVGFFTADSSGRSQIRALNIRAGGGYYGNCTGDNLAPCLNSASNPVKGGDILEMYLTGEGLDVEGVMSIQDGAAPGPGRNTMRLPQVFLGSGRKLLPDSEVLYSGLNSEYPGLWQINIRIPKGDGAPIGPAVPIQVIYRTSDSWRVNKFLQTIAVTQ